MRRRREGTRCATRLPDMSRLRARSPAKRPTSSLPRDRSRRSICSPESSLPGDVPWWRSKIPAIPPCTRPSRPSGRRSFRCRSTRRESSSKNCRATRNVICVTPSHQFPLGVAMSMRRRAACSNSRSGDTRSSSKTTTTASSASAAARSTRCSRSIARSRSSTSAPLRRACSRGSAWVSWWRRPGRDVRSPRPRRVQTCIAR